MNREEVLASIIEFAARAYKKDASEIGEGTSLTELGVQSIQRVAMSASIEEEYEVMIPVAKFGQFATVGELVDFVIKEAE